MQQNSRAEAPSQFNLKPTHTHDSNETNETSLNLFSNPFTSNGSLFRGSSNENLTSLSRRRGRSNSPAFGNTATLPTSAAPFIYADKSPDSPSRESQTSNAFYQASAPPLLKQVTSKMRSRRSSKHRNAPPSAAETIKAAAAMGVVATEPLTTTSTRTSSTPTSYQQSRVRHSPQVVSNLQNSSLISFSASSKSRSSSNDNLSNYTKNIHDNNIDDDPFNFDFEEEELKLPPSISSKITNHVTRTDPSGKPYTSYIIQVHTTVSSQTSVPMTVEHRYSEFARLERSLAQYSIEIHEPFPKRHWAGRLGNWTPSTTIAPQRYADLIARRKYQLNAWLVEVTSKYPKRAHQPLPLEFKLYLWEFLSKSSKEIPPCNRENNLKGNDSSPFLDESDLILEKPNMNQSLQMSIATVGKTGTPYLANPLSFTLGSAIREAANTVRTMCSSTSTLKIRDDASDQAIPLDLLHSARGLVFLTVAKGGFIFSFRGGTGLIIVRKRGTNLWSAPSALGTVGMGWGALIGGDITTYLIVLNTEEAVKAFVQPSGNVNLGAELDVAVGPLGRGAGGNVGTGARGGVVPAYAYAHSKGLFAGISFEGSLVACRPDVNSKFYGRPVTVQEILFGTKGDVDEKPIQPPRAAQPLYDALFDAMNLIVPENGFRPSRILRA